MVRRLLSDEYWDLIRHFFEQPSKRGRPQGNTREIAIRHYLQVRDS